MKIMSPHARSIVVAVAVVGSALLACGTKHDDPPALLSRAEMLDPASCNKCHADHYREWSGSMHAYAADDPVFLAMNARGQRETNGALGSFCVNCHAPMAVREGLTTDGLNLATVPKAMKGVTCFFCHTIDQVTGTHDAAVTLSQDLVMRGAISDPVANTAHAAGYSELHDRDTLASAKLCGACHDIVNGHGAAIERTFQEWQGSVFAHPESGTTCGQCHMDQSPNLRPIADAPGVFARRFHAHTLSAVDVALTPDFPEKEDQLARVTKLLSTTIQSALCVRPRGNLADLRVIIDNVAAGHAFPSGSAQDRRLWFEVIAYQGSTVVYSSGAAQDGTEITALTDPDLWLVRDCMFDDAAKQVSMFWQASSTETNLFPPQLTFDQADPRYYQTHIVQSYPRSGTALKMVPDRVTLRARLQPIGADVLADLVASGDLDKSVAAAMPTFDLGVAPILEWTTATGKTAYVEDGFPVSCISTTSLNAAADKVPAVNHTRCKP